MATTWDRWLHPTIASTAESRRSALILGVGAAMAVAVVSSQLLVSLSARHYADTLPGLAFLVVPLAVFVLLRVRPTTTLAGHVLMFASVALISVAVIGEDALYASSIAWYGVACAAGITSVGIRGGIGWLVVALSITALAAVMRHAGIVTPWLHPSERMELVRGVGLVVAFVVLAALFERTRRSTHAEVVRLAQSQSQFLANISHELRTPMNGVLGLTDLLLRSKLDAQQREDLELLQRSGRSLVVLLNDLLDMSKVEAGKMQLDPVDFDLRALLVDLEALHAPIAEAKGLTLSFTLEPLPVAVRGDAMRLRQVLTNLLSNAIKFTERGSVRLEMTAPEPSKVGFLVRDTGIGISSEAMPRLFSKFAQAEAGTTRRFGGTGLGLALSRELVSLMDGKLTVHSELGKGTAMQFTIPLEPSIGALVRADPPADFVPRAATLHPVLVVDDNPINLKVACALVEKAGYTTRSARNGAEALAIVSREPVALVLMDCHMPVMDGFEATEKIRALDSDMALVPIVALTASAMPEELVRCRKAGMNDCLIKPVTLDQLSRTLHQIVSAVPFT